MLHSDICPITGLSRCSDGTDRNRQSWLKNRCDTYNVSNIQQCSATGQVRARGSGNGGSIIDMKYFQPFPGKSNNYEKDDPSHSKISHIPDYHDSHDSQTGFVILFNHIAFLQCLILVETVHTGSVVVSVFITMLVISFLGWIGYAYFNPNTSSGRFLIKVYRDHHFIVYKFINQVISQYRPGAWRWRQSGGRYTAASIHM